MIKKIYYLSSSIVCAGFLLGTSPVNAALNCATVCQGDICGFSQRLADACIAECGKDPGIKDCRTAAHKAFSQSRRQKQEAAGDEIRAQRAEKGNATNQEEEDIGTGSLFNENENGSAPQSDENGNASPENEHNNEADGVPQSDEKGNASPENEHNNEADGAPQSDENGNASPENEHNNEADSAPQNDEKGNASQENEHSDKADGAPQDDEKGNASPENEHSNEAVSHAKKPHGGLGKVCELPEKSIQRAIHILRGIQHCGAIGHETPNAGNPDALTPATHHARKGRHGRMINHNALRSERKNLRHAGERRLAPRKMKAAGQETPASKTPNAGKPGASSLPPAGLRARKGKVGSIASPSALKSGKKTPRPAGERRLAPRRGAVAQSAPAGNHPKPTAPKKAVAAAAKPGTFHDSDGPSGLDKIGKMVANKVLGASGAAQ